MAAFDVNAFMTYWVLGGRLVNIIIALTVLEVIALLMHNRITKRGLRPQDYLLNLLSGLCLMLALRSVLGGAAWLWVAGYLSAAGLAHAADMLARYKRQSLKQPF